MQFHTFKCIHFVSQLSALYTQDKGVHATFRHIGDLFTCWFSVFSSMSLKFIKIRNSFPYNIPKCFFPQRQLSSLELRLLLSAGHWSFVKVLWFCCLFISNLFIRWLIHFSKQEISEVPSVTPPRFSLTNDKEVQDAEEIIAGQDKTRLS